ncbi:MAG: hypothetical protein LBU95_05355 [Rikenellaceae bacterium]|jgi:hypothetical protein|nr:hypothetical protein [Rikenellaceae bacterium]
MKKPFYPVIAAVLLAVAAGCSRGDMGLDDDVIPVHLIGIQAVNVNNEGEYPFVTTEKVRKEAYMLGVQWILDNADPGGDQYVTGPIVGQGKYTRNPQTLPKRIYTVGAFNASNPDGSNVSQYFKQIEYLPDAVDEGFVLLVAPDPGAHAFRVVYYDGTNQYEYTTPEVELY